MATLDITPAARSELLALLQQYLPGVTVWAFGSRVKGTSRRHSDLDLVLFSRPEQAAQVALLHEALEESSLPFRVDLLVWENIPASFQHTIQACYAVLDAENPAPIPTDGPADGPADGQPTHPKPEDAR